MKSQKKKKMMMMKKEEGKKNRTYDYASHFEFQLDKPSGNCCLIVLLMKLDGVISLYSRIICVRDQILVPTHHAAHAMPNV